MLSNALCRAERAGRILPAYPYNISYQCPSHAAPDQRISALCDDHIFPAIDRKLEAEGYQSWYYARGTETRWNVGS